MKKIGRVRTPAAPSSDGRVARPARPHAPWPRVKLGEVCEICPGTRVRRKDSQGGEYPVYGGGGATFTWPNYNREDQLIVSRFAMSEECVRFVKGRFFLNDSGLSVASSDKRLSQAYLDWCLYGKQPEIYALGRGAAQKNLDMEQFPLLEISLPPLPVQREIVARLERELGAVDKLAKKFEELETAAEAEFKAELKETFEMFERFEKFEGFEGLGEDEMVGRSVPDRRNRMTTKNALCDGCGGEGTRRPTAVRWFKLGDILETISTRGHQIKQSEIRKIGALPVVSQSEKAIEGFTDVSIAITDVPLVLFGDHTCVVKLIKHPFVVGADGVKLLRVHGTCVEYFYHWLQQATLILLDGEYRRHFSDLSELTFPLPPLPIQRTIVARLDAAKAKKEALVAAAKRGKETAALWRKAILKEAFE